MKTIEGHDVKIFTDNIEENALEQIKELLSIDVFSDKKIRIMPDVHAGAGCVIGFTGDLGDKVIPNIVGVDIGCGMRILNLGKLSEIDFHAFHEHIRGNVPSGMIVREDRFGFKPLVGEEMDIYREAKQLVIELYCYREIKDSGRINKAIGSLGGGNHFIELDKDDEGNVYLVIHTGSRNLGKQVADIYQAKAVKHLTDGADEFEEIIKRTIEEYKAAGKQDEVDWLLERWPDGTYRDVIGLCKVAKIAGEDGIEDNDWSLNAGRYVGVVIEDDGMTENEFCQEMLTLNGELSQLSAEAEDLQKEIEKNMKDLFGEE